MPEIAGALVRVPFPFGMLDGNVTVGHVGVVVVPAVAVVRLVFVGAVIVDAICSLHVGIALELELVYLFVYLRDRIWSPLWSRGWIFGGVVVCPSNNRFCGNLTALLWWSHKLRAIMLVSLWLHMGLLCTPSVGIPVIAAAVRMHLVGRKAVR